ncbi:MAG: aminopeptidase [Gallicola sp.]|nr:aminopeptidase [Gallicola sp.]
MKEYDKNIWSSLDETEIKKLMDFSEGYKEFLNKGKTERLAVKEIINQAEKKGFINVEEISKGSFKNQKIYYNYKNKAVVLMVLGNDLREGMNIIGSHIDSPRLDLKPEPLYEDGNLALFKTHYYGGIKKYQWTTIPLALYGTMFNSEGEKIEISIGNDKEDPVFFINDLLIHLGKDQMKKSLADGIEAEQLNVIAGHIAESSDENEGVKENVLRLLKEKYDIEEEDFRISELEVVPADRARDVGFDRGLIAAYGQDDRVCAYTSLQAILEIEKPEKTAAALFVDKEEIGSVGNTSMNAKFFENLVAELLALSNDYNDLYLRRALAASNVLSADVTVAFDPTFPEVLEKNNAAKLAHGVTLTKYTGKGGKGGSNDANGEYLNKIRQIFKEDDIIWQTGELGKVDQGGGGTIAYILAEHGAEVVDMGVAMHSMHAPIELTSKADVYMTYRAYKTFYEKMK